MKNLKILIIEDEELIAEILAEYLEESLPTEIEIASNGLEGLQMSQTKKFHLIIVDYFMPVMDGIQFVKGLRNQSSNVSQNTPTIMLSAYLEEAKDKLKTATNMFFLEKSLFKENLLPLIKKIVEEGNI